MNKRPLNFGAIAALLLALLAPAVPGTAGAAAVQSEHISAELVADLEYARPGGAITVALRLVPDAHWHTYWQNPGDSGLPTRIDWKLPAGVSASEIRWPFPERQSLGPLTNYGYSGEHLLLSTLRLPADLAGDALNISATAHWLVCDDICIPGEAELSLQLPIAAQAARPPTPSQWADTINAAESRVPVWLQADASHAIADQLRLQVTHPTLSNGSLEFFPVTADVVDNAAPSLVLRQAERVEWRQALSDFIGEPPKAMDAVVVIDGQRAIRLRAQLVGEATLKDMDSADTVGAAVEAAGSPIGIGLVLLFAMLGGLLLNLMPCVFPVLSIKAMAVAQGGGQSPAQRRAHALAYTLGVVLGFVALAATLLALRAGGQAIGWGFQLQLPWVIALLAWLMLLLGLSLHGYVEIGTRLMGIGQSLTEQAGLRGALFTGLLACIVATPCTAPFMGTAMGYALTQPTALALLVFVALGLGMALPFLLIGFVPAIGRMLPRPGPWMQTFKVAMAFPMYLTAVWLAWVLGRQAGVNAMAALLVGATALIAAVWLWRGGTLAKLTAIACIAAAGALLAGPWMASAASSSPSSTSATTDSRWESYSQDRLQSLLTAGTPVFINLTADWCVTCHVNEAVALNTDDVRNAFVAGGVALLKGDWTHRDPAITALLEAHQRNGVPLYLLYSGRQGSAPVVLPQVLTPGIVLRELAAIGTASPN